VGIIGRNGAGKSTLLKILSRITEPTSGYAKIHGRVGSLLEVGTGFHPELTGRENIYLNGALLGMKKAEIDRKFDEIVAFAEVERFIDTPVKRYSSGMYVRLAFAVAAHLEPDILIVDEVLAVGDAAFQKKCMGKMGEVADEGRTVLLVSHNMASIEGISRSAYLLDQGRLLMTGKTRDVVEAYLASLPLSVNQSLSQREERQGDGRLRFTNITFRSPNNSPVDVVQCGQDFEISVKYESNTDRLRNILITIPIFTLTGQCMLMLNNQMVGTDFESVPSLGNFSCVIKRFPLAPGQYYLNLYCEVNGILADWVQQAAYLTVEGGDFFGTGQLPPRTHGGMLVPQNWRVANLVKEV
jgi:lipopolysaccharide transport system ATP-binding protein